jgi:1-acyl-sn-glycerol-3-phosphate acyltransferase
MYIIQILLSYIAKFILILLGWKYITEKQFSQFHKYKRSVIVFSHTTYADFYLFLLYFLAFPNEFRNVRVLVKPQPFKYAGFILRRFGCIPSSSFEERNSGSTRRISEELDKDDNFIFLISPKGTIVKSEWRNGYYNIALNTKSHLMVTGLDYEKKKIIVSDDIKYDKDKDDIEIFLKEQLSRIVPLYPEDEVMKIRKHKSRSIISTPRLIFLFLLFLLMILWH